MKNNLLDKFYKSGFPGIVSLDNWIMGEDGNTFLYLYSKQWKILTDKEVPIENFHSSEKWQILGFNGKKLKMVIPGCQIKSVCICEKAPKTPNCCEI